MEYEWKRKKSITAFPYFWQRPAKTEEWVYEKLIENESNSVFVEFICFPWATLIDLISRRKDNRVEQLISVLNKLKPKQTIIRATACQHICIETILPILNKHKITDLFWAHKVKGQDKLNGIRIHSLPLYPVSYYDRQNEKIQGESGKYLYSFIGTYSSQGYLSDIRLQIFNYPANEKSIIKRREHWHFENEVYKKQIDGVQLEFAEEVRGEINMAQYLYTLKSSKYSLCPSGAGPNTIRFWESLAHGVKPILLSDTWDPPNIINNTHYVQWGESDFSASIDELLRVSDENKNQQYQIQQGLSPNKFLDEVCIDLFCKEYIKNYLIGNAV